MQLVVREMVPIIRRNALRALLLALLPLLAGACTTAVPAPAGSESAALGITVESRSEPGRATSAADAVYFVRLESGTELGRTRKVLRSNFSKGDRVYLLNAKPGRYAVVAASETVLREASRRDGDSDRFRTVETLDNFRVFTSYFDTPLIQGTEVEVAPGAFAVLGRFLVQVRGAIEDGDALQVHFHRVVDPKLVDPYGSPIVDPDNSVAMRATLVERQGGTENEREFLQLALQDLKESGWTERVQRSLDALPR